MPCGCPNPQRAAGSLSELFGRVCDRCEAYNDPTRATCLDCGAPLEAPAPVPAPAASESAKPPFAKPAVVPPAPPAPIPLVAPIALQQPAKAAAEGRVIPLEKAKVIPLPLEAAKAQPQAGAGKVISLDKSKEVSGAQRCPRCGTENPADFRYCSECGLAFKAAAPPPMAGASPHPIAPGRASVRVLRGEKLGQTYPLGEQATAGRGNATISFPSDPFLAGLHCTLLFQGGRLFVRDEGSPSGTFVRLRAEEPLAPGDYFAVGDHLLRYAGSLPPPGTASDGTKLYGSPRPPGGAVKIEELHQGLVPGRASVRLGPTLSVGRDESCYLSFAGDSYVSSRHCSITVAPGGRASLRDLGSTNGTFRRLAPRSERELLNGDCLRLGAQVLQIFETK